VRGRGYGGIADITVALATSVGGGELRWDRNGGANSSSAESVEKRERDREKITGNVHLYGSDAILDLTMQFIMGGKRVEIEALPLAPPPPTTKKPQKKTPPPSLRIS